MKKLGLILAALLLVPCAVFAIDANQLSYVQILAPVSSAATTGTAVNVSSYKGNAAFCAQFAASTVASTGTVTFVHSATSGGTYTTITNLAGTAAVITQTGPATNDVQSVPCDLARLHPYVKAVVAQAGITNAVSAFMSAPMKSQ